MPPQETRILVGFDITHKSTVLMLFTKLTWYYTQVYRLDITHKFAVLILHTRLYNKTSPPQSYEDT